MIRLYYSNQLEELVNELVKTSARAQKSWDIPTSVIVPNKNISTYLKLQIARRTGVAADVQTHYLNSFSKKVLKPGRKILDKRALQNFIFDLLTDDTFLASESMTGVRKYLSFSAPQQRESRIFHLTSKLAGLFEEYALSRQRLITQWKKTTVIKDDIFSESEVWQRAIWNAIFLKSGKLEEVEERTGFKWILPADVFSHPDDFDIQKIPKELHFFALSYVALAYYKSLSDLSAYTNVSIYALNPCMEYWEDVPQGWSITRPKRFKKRKSEQSELIFGDEMTSFTEDPPALQAWGRPGRDHIHLLNMLTDCDFESAFVDPSEHSNTLLHRLQHDILVRLPSPEKALNLDPDDSISILSCPSIQREVEAIAEEIWRLIDHYQKRGEKLHFHEIAVIVNQDEKEKYQSRIGSVFEGAFSIPHNVVDVSGQNNRQYLEGVKALLELPFSGFERLVMLRLLTHPNALAKTPHVHPDQWIYWCDSLSVFHGGDSEDHQDTYIDKNLYHWDQALRRLNLGVFMSDENTPFECEDGKYLPIEVPTSSLHDAAILSQSVRNLIHHSRELQKKIQPLKDWAASLRHYFSTFLEPITNEDEYSQAWCWDRLQQMEDSDLSGKAVSFEIAALYFQNDLEAMMITRGHYLTEGVVVSSFLPMRPIPFKVVFIAGLGDRQFPQRDPRSPLDLRWVEDFRPARGDMVSPRARDEYMFLETLISTREKLVLSYVDQDQHTGEKQHPSEVVRQLQFMLSQNYLQENEDLVIQVPLHRHEKRGENFSKDNYLPEIPFELWAIQTRDELSKVGEKAQCRVPKSNEIQTHFSKKASTRLVNLLKLPKHRNHELKLPSRITVHLRSLKHFLESPLQAAAEYHLQLWNEEKVDLFDRNEEIFELDFRSRSQLLDKILKRCMEDPGLNFEDIIHHQCQISSLKGTFPSGLFAVAEERRIRDLFRHWIHNLQVFDTDLYSLHVYDFGSSTISPLVIGEVDIHGQKAEVELIGSTGPVDLNAMRSVLFKPMTYRPANSDNWSIDGFLDLLLLQASEIQTPTCETWEVAINLARIQNRDHLYTFSKINQHESQNYFINLVQDLITSSQSYIFPSQAVFQHKHGLPLKEAIDKIRNDKRHSSHRGPVRTIDSVPLPSDPQALIRRRFDLYFDHLQKNDGDLL